MVETSIGERFCVWWWDTEGEDWMQNLAMLLGWPYPVETLNEEGWNGGF